MPGKKKERKTRALITGPLMLIVCNGNTEIKYINDYISSQNNGKASSKISVVTSPKTHLSLIDEVQKLLALPKYNSIDVAKKEKRVWLVLDADLSPTRVKEYDNFNRTVANNQYSVAWSNPCIELWFLLHFDELSTPLTVEDCIKKFEEKFVKYGEARCDKKQKIISCTESCDFKSYNKAKSPTYCFTKRNIEIAKKRAYKKCKAAQHLVKAHKFHAINPGSNMYELLDTIKKTIKDEGK